MDFFRDVIHHPASVFNPETLIRYGGLLLVVLMVFAETGIFFCFFFPGDSLVFTAGVLTATGGLSYNVYVVCIALIAAAIAGNLVGYYFGKKTGPMLFKRKDSIFFKQEYLIMAEKFYAKYGGAALILGRFLPVIRTFAPIVAGVIKVDLKIFIFYSIAGAVIWVVPLVTAGYLLGNQPFVKENLEYIIILMVVLFTTPIIIKFFRESKKLKKEEGLRNP